MTDPSDEVRPLLRVRQVREFTDQPVDAKALDAIAIVMAVEPGSGISHAYDEGRAAERILIAASLIGLGAGIAWVRSEMRPAVGEVLGLPEDRFARTVVAIGHPSEAAKKPKSAPGEARLPREESVLHERWPAG